MIDLDTDIDLYGLSAWPLMTPSTIDYPRAVVRITITILFVFPFGSMGTSTAVMDLTPGSIPLIADRYVAGALFGCLPVMLNTSFFEQ